MMKKRKETDREMMERLVKVVLKDIKSLEKKHTPHLVETACSRYKAARLKKRNAEKEISRLQTQLDEAKGQLG